MNGSLVERLVPCLMLALGTAVAVLGTVPGGASASAAPPHRLRPEVHTVPGAKMSLAQAPAGLRAVVRRTLGAPAAAGGAFQQAKLTASDGAPGDIFGVSVAISGSTAVVGASFKNSNTGAAYVFVRSGAVWSQQAKLTAADGSSFDRFGTSVAISGPTAVVGAFGQFSNTGAAYVFVRSGTAWHQQARLTAADPAKDSVFGISVAVSGPTVVVGANHLAGSGTGAAYVFVRSGPAWSQQAKLTAPGPATIDLFGTSVAILGSAAVVGAPGQTSPGAAYVFARSGTAWHRQAKLTASDGASRDFFGGSVAISRSTAVAGADGNNAATGAAYVYVNV